MSETVAADEEVEFDPQRDRLVITASSLGTVFEWYDFFVYGTLAALLGRLFFAQVESATLAFLLSLATFAVGFLVRPIGAVIFGYLGDKVGRKYTFLVTITLMGLATACIGLLPTHAQIGVVAPILLVVLRVIQGLALGGEYGGAAIYVAEHAPRNRRGFYTGFIQASVSVGFLLALGVVIGTTAIVGEEEFVIWGWRVPFLISLLLLAISLWIRLKLNESPVFQKMKAAGRNAANPLKESFESWTNVKLILVALFGIAAGLTVIWYNAQFYTLYFLQSTSKVSEADARELIAYGVIVAAPAFVFFGWLSDKVGRRKVMITGYALTLALLFPLYQMIAGAANPALAEAMANNPVTISVPDDCGYDALSDVQATECARSLEWFVGSGIDFSRTDGPFSVEVADIRFLNFDPQGFADAVGAAGYPERSDPEARSDGTVLFGIIILSLLSAATYGPVAAILVELFPARIRYTSMSIPYHIGTGVFGGLLPFVSQLIVVQTGAVFAGLWYTFVIVSVALVTTMFFLPETAGKDISG
ncbi:MAG: MFS transporter [Pacificimonas sp.]